MRRIVFIAALLFSAVLGKDGGKGGGGSDDDDGNDSSVSSSPFSSPSSTQPTIPAPSTSVSATPVSTSSSASSPSATASPFQFTPPSNATMCQAFTISWSYIGNTDIPLTIAVTNERAVQGSLDANPATVPLISRTLTNDTLAMAGKLVWGTVDVPVGWYVAVAFDTTHTAGISGQSVPFFVQNGSDASCLAAETSTLTTTPVQSTMSRTATPAPQTSAVPSASPSAGKQLSAGVLAGIIIAIIVGVIFLVIIFTYPQWKRTPRSNTARPGAPYYLF